MYLFRRRVFARCENAPVAQLDRVLPSEGRGFGFKSQRVHFLVSEVNHLFFVRHFSPHDACMTIFDWLRVGAYLPFTAELGQAGNSLPACAGQQEASVALKHHRGQ
jgi:hypothetical protein